LQEDEIKQFHWQLRDCILENSNSRVKQDNPLGETYFSKNSIAVVGHHDPTHGVQQHLQPKEQQYLHRPVPRVVFQSACSAGVSAEVLTFIIALGPRHVRMMSAIV